MKKFFVTTLFLTFLINNTYCQRKSESIVKYSDGSYFIGEILDRDEQKIKMRSSTNDILHLDIKNIVKIREGEEIFLYNNRKFHRKKGFFISTDLALISTGWNVLQTTLILAIRLPRRFAVGGGTSRLRVESHAFQTFFGYGRYYITNNKKRLFTDLRFGYGYAREGHFTIEEDHNGGAHVQPGLGIVFSSKNNFRFKLSMAQVLQKTSGYYEYHPSLAGQPYKILFSYTILKLGIQFM